MHRTYLKNKREALGKTVIDLADLIGISTDYYSQLENGFRGKRLSVKMLIRIAKSLDMNLCEAIKGESDFIKKKEEMTFICFSDDVSLFDTVFFPDTYLA